MKTSIRHLIQSVLFVKHFRHLGPYEIGKTLGRGGMGTVYEGTVRAQADQPQGERVAIKVLNPQFAMAEGFRERFEAEIESLKKLRHENIVRLFGYGEQDGILFYAMELVDGPSLEDELNAGERFNWREVTEIGIAVCKALKYVHDHGVIHRDLKPANLLLTDRRQVKLSDFGIARLFGSNQLTQAGGLLGTAEFMSPEQADGRLVTNCCDQYSLGGVLYTLLAGRCPLQADTMPEMLQLQRFAQPEPVHAYAPDTPQELERIIMQLMEKNPESRFPNTAIVARQLEAMLHALSRPISADFEIVDPDAPATDSVPISLTETIDGSQHERASGVPDGASNAGPSNADVSTEATQPTARDRFTTVEQDERRAQMRRPHPSPLALLQIFGLVASLLVIGLVGWYLSRPPTADALYMTIQTAAEIGTDVALGRTEDEMRDFLERFPDDPRAAQVGDYLEDIEVARLDRTLRNRVRRSSSGSLTPLERLYVEAVDLAEKNPHLAIERLQAMLQLYTDGPPTDVGETTSDAQRRERCLKLARRQLAQLQQQYDESVAQQRDELQQQLRRAVAMQATDPGRGRAMLTAIVRLYGDKPWATEFVQQAKGHIDAKNAGRNKR